MLDPDKRFARLLTPSEAANEKKNEISGEDLNRKIRFEAANKAKHLQDVAMKEPSTLEEALDLLKEAVRDD